jgi:hypothetical protein
MPLTLFTFNLLRSVTFLRGNVYPQGVTYSDSMAELLCQVLVEASISAYLRVPRILSNECILHNKIYKPE